MTEQDMNSWGTRKLRLLVGYRGETTATLASSTGMSRRTTNKKLRMLERGGFLVSWYDARQRVWMRCQ